MPLSAPLQMEKVEPWAISFSMNSASSKSRSSSALLGMGAVAGGGETGCSLQVELYGHVPAPYGSVQTKPATTRQPANCSIARRSAART